MRKYVAVAPRDAVDTHNLTLTQQNVSRTSEVAFDKFTEGLGFKTHLRLEVFQLLNRLLVFQLIG